MKKSTSSKNNTTKNADVNDDNDMEFDDIYVDEDTNFYANSPGYRSCGCEDYPCCGCDA